MLLCPESPVLPFSLEYIAFASSRNSGFISYVKDGILWHLPLFDIIKAGQYMIECRTSFHIMADQVAYIFAWRCVNAGVTRSTIDEFPQFICQ